MKAKVVYRNGLNINSNINNLCDQPYFIFVFLNEDADKAPQQLAKKLFNETLNRNI